jgi:hypothetical protein
MNKLGRILMVEDDAKDVELTLTALEDYNLANEPSIISIAARALRRAPRVTPRSCCWI